MLWPRMLAFQCATKSLFDAASSDLATTRRSAAAQAPSPMCPRRDRIQAAWEGTAQTDM